MPGELVLAILDALGAAGVECWVGGGWGVEALAGRHTRIHRDLDLVIEDRDNQRAIEVLEDLGYSEWYRAYSDECLATRIVLHDDELAGRVVDLHPLQLPHEHVEFAEGEIQGQPVPCLSVASQLEAHSNYRARRRDRADIAVLRGLDKQIG